MSNISPITPEDAAECLSAALTREQEAVNALRVLKNAAEASLVARAAMSSRAIALTDDKLRQAIHTANRVLGEQ